MCGALVLLLRMNDALLNEVHSEARLITRDKTDAPAAFSLPRPLHAARRALLSVGSVLLTMKIILNPVSPNDEKQRAWILADPEFATQCLTLLDCDDAEKTMPPIIYRKTSASATDAHDYFGSTMNMTQRRMEHAAKLAKALIVNYNTRRKYERVYRKGAMGDLRSTYGTGGWLAARCKDPGGYHGLWSIHLGNLHSTYGTDAGR